MGSKATRQKGDGLTVRQRARKRLLENLHEGKSEFARPLGNGVMRVQTQNPSEGGA